MAAVVIDLVDGGVITDASDGITATRVAKVEGLTGNAATRMFNALTTSGIPPRGSFHPVIADIRVVSISARSDTPGIATVTITYKSFSGEDEPADDTAIPLISVGSTVQETETNIDRSGNDIILEHTFTDIDADGAQTTRTETQTGVVRLQTPQTVLSFTRREFQSPLILSGFVTGTVNQDNFLGFIPRSWLMRSIEGASDDGGVTFNVTYIMQLNLSTWDARVVFIDPETGRPPVGLIPGIGTKTVQIYGESNFGALNIG